MPDVTNADGRESVRLARLGCGYTVAAAIWCRDARCCDRDPGRFRASLVPAGKARAVNQAGRLRVASAPRMRPYPRYGDGLR